MTDKCEHDNFIPTTVNLGTGLAEFTCQQCGHAEWFPFKTRCGLDGKLECVIDVRGYVSHIETRIELGPTLRTNVEYESQEKP